MSFEIMLEKFLEEELSPEELTFFLAAVKEPANEPALLRAVGEKLDNKNDHGLSNEAVIPEMFRAMLEKAATLERAAILERAGVPEKAAARPLFTIRRIAAAAAIILLAGAGFYFIKTKQTPPATAQQESRFQNDIAPGGDKAMLTLANGHTILLDSTSNGTLARQGNSSVVKLSNSQLAYRPADDRSTRIGQGQVASALTYNTLSTPRGGQYQLTLPDGSKVWLNAASSIRYPTAFTGKERKVEITGEAYFEVAKNAAMPFKVKIGSSRGEIEVLGTSFNIVAYEDDTAACTTLLEGAVRITKGQITHTIAPGQQLITGATSMRVVPEVDVQKIIAWKNGKFIFYNDDINSIMKQLTRWYDIDVRFEKVVNDHYTGRISRQVNISQVLKMMEAAGGVTFSVRGKEVKID